MVRHRSPPRGDYIHITGETSGCWSYVGRIGGVSNTGQVVDKTCPALRTAPLGFRSHPPDPPPTPKDNTNPLRFISHYTTHLCEKFSNRPVRNAVTQSRTSCEFTNVNIGMLTVEIEIWLSKYLFVY